MGLWDLWLLFFNQNAGLRTTAPGFVEKQNPESVMPWQLLPPAAFSPAPLQNKNLWVPPAAWGWVGAGFGNRRWSTQVTRAETPSAEAGHIKGSQGGQFPFSLECLVLRNPEALFKG